MRLRLPPIAASGAALLLMPPPATAAARTYTVVMDKMKFGPVPSGLHKGDAIMWVNHDFLRHTATAADPSFAVNLPAGATKSIVLQRSGTIAFACRFHLGMRGQLQVK